MTRCVELTIRGQVQGVGFRPHVYTIATELALSGSVHNDGGGVKVSLWATPSQLEEFLRLLSLRLPPLATIDELDTQTLQRPEPANGFVITPSQQNRVDTQISPDAATCDACLEEIFDPGNRRYFYPFTNCTHCGPRFSIIKQLPYDRPYTTMAEFCLCERCQQEYDSPLDRRFHAQPNACAECGPRLTLFDNQLTPVAGVDPIRHTAELLARGNIIAIKGLGGYHLACDASNPDAVNQLRERKQRKTKPLTLMVANLASAEVLTELTPPGRDYLRSAGAPIVLLKKKTDRFDDLAPGMNSLGVMLPYTPLHHLLFHQLNEVTSQSPGSYDRHRGQPHALVMTSANRRGQPLIFQDQQLEQLSELADYVLTHDRQIDKRIDDAIVNCTGDDAIIIRRGRGMAPKAIPLANPGKSTLALGGYFKNSICLTKGNKAYLSQYIGDLDNPDNCRYLSDTVEHLMAIFQVTPEQVAADLHPDFYSSQFARQFADKHGLPLVPVQHHHAHAAAIACEHQLSGPYLALSLDGVGLGDDGQSWGGELLRVDKDSSQRLGYCRTLRLPGGDRAAREPWRLAVAFLVENDKTSLANEKFGHHPGYSMIIQMAERQVNCPTTSSVGRLFDLAAALLGLTDYNSFEAEAAMLLESAADTGNVTITEPLFSINKAEGDGQGRILDFTPLLMALTGMDCHDGAATFHHQLVLGFSQWLESIDSGDCHNIVLAGGCFLNQRLTSELTRCLRANQLNVFTASQVPPNDSSLALGQAWVAINSAQGAEVCA